MALTDNLVSYWKLDEASGDALDAHGSNDLTDNNTVGSATGLISNARDLERSDNEYFSHTSNSDLEMGDIDFTWSFWLKAESYASFTYILSKKDAFDNDFEVYWNDNYLHVEFGFLHANLWLVGTSTAWMHVVIWHDSTANEIGISVNNDTPGTSGTGGDYGPVSSGDFRLGHRGYSGGTPGWDGLIDEVGFWKRVLTSGERTQLYNSGSGLAYADFGGGGVTGSLSATLGAVTSSAAATVGLSGALTATLGALTLAASVAVPVIATATPTLADATLSSSASVAVTGSLSGTLDDTTLSASASSGGIEGTLSATLGAIISASSGEVPVTGTSGGTLADVSGSATATVALTGSVSATLADTTASATVSVPITATAAPTLADVTASATASVGNTGSAAPTLGDVTSTATATVAVTGTLAATLAAITCFATDAVSSAAWFFRRFVLGRRG